MHGFRAFCGILKRYAGKLFKKSRFQPLIAKVGLKSQLVMSWLFKWSS